VDRYFEKGDAQWRGIGNIQGSGLYIRKEFAAYDLGSCEIIEDTPFMSGCICGSVITGKKLPAECAYFGRECTPLSPKGPCMVSPEGACGIWHSQAKGGLNRT
jgi:hydrogenase expression/formation protein HypD